MRIVLHRVFTFILLFIGGNLLAGISIGLIAMIYGISPVDLIDSIQAGELLDKEIIRSSIWTQTISIFVLPSIAFGLLFYKRRQIQYFKLGKAPAIPTLFLSILFLAAGYPFVQAAFELNEMLPLSDWMVDLEGDAAAVLEEVLQMENFIDYLSVLIIVAVLPAIGEELAFRGILQRQFTLLFKNSHVAVWLAAFIFSAIHFQFEGLLPRMVLGAILGYLYAWTHNLWIPICIHFINNGVQVSMLYLADVDLSQFEEGSPQLPWWWLIPALIAIIVLARTLNQHEPVEDVLINSPVDPEDPVESIDDE